MKSRFNLEKMQEKDFDAFLILTGNKQVMALITGRPLTREEALAKFTSLLKNNGLHKSLGSFLVRDASESKLMGFAKLEITRQNRTSAELGFMFLPEFWGKGYGREIAARLMQVAESVPELTRVWANIDPGNMASRKILLGLGFIIERTGMIDGLPSEILGKNLKFNE
jgi:RimJ/RimL family protein N-acetyltransferase